MPSLPIMAVPMDADQSLPKVPVVVPAVVVAVVEVSAVCAIGAVAASCAAMVIINKVRFMWFPSVGLDEFCMGRCICRSMIFQPVAGAIVPENQTGKAAISWF